MAKKNSQKKKTKENGRISKIFESDFNINKETLPRFLPFVLFLSFLIILYIANKNYADKNLLELNKLKKEIKDLRAESLTTKNELMNKSKRSEVIEMGKEIGLEEPKKPPQKIVVEKDEY